MSLGPARMIGGTAVVTVLTCLAVIAPFIALAAGGVLAAGALVTLLLGRRLVAASRHSRRRRARLTGDVTERLYQLGTAMYPHRSFWSVLAGPSLVLELIAPVARLHPVTERVWAVGAFSMHWGIKAVMNIMFRYQSSGAAYASFVPWDLLWRALPRPR